MTEEKTTTEQKATTENKVRNCLIAVDGSEHADYALEWFIENIHRKGDHVVLVYVPELNDILHSAKWTTTAVYQFDRELMDSMLKDEQARIKADLDKFAQKLKDHGLGGKVKSVMANRPGEGIIKAALDEPGHLIVTGSRGHGQLRRTFMGSVSDYVVHHSHIPVFVCKHPHKHIPGHEAHKKTDASDADKADKKTDASDADKTDNDKKTGTTSDSSSAKKEESSSDKTEQPSEKDEASKNES